MNALDIALNIGVAAVTVAVVLCAWRLLRGPEMTDRLLALDTLYMNAVALIVLLASMLVAFSQGRPGIAELLITLFVFVTAPVSANLMAQAALHLRLASRARVPDGAVPERRKG